MMTDHEKLDAFGRLLVTKVRDNVLDDLEAILHGQMKPATAREMYTQIEESLDEHGKEILRLFATNMVDRSLHHLLVLIEESPSISLCWNEGSKSTELSQVSDGLAGELYSDDGWIKKV